MQKEKKFFRLSLWLNEKKSPSKSFTYNFNAHTLFNNLYLQSKFTVHNFTGEEFFFVSRNYINDSWAVRMKRNKNIFKAKMLWEVKTKPKYVLDDGFVMVKLKY